MTAKGLAVALGLAVSATSTAWAQSLGMYGDRPYYDSDSSGWLDYQYHPGIDFPIAPPARAHLAAHSRRTSA
jgi:hypothetical protein